MSKRFALSRSTSHLWSLSMQNLFARNTIVFEIYDTLGKSFSNREDAAAIIAEHPECIVKNVDGHILVMFPHFIVLLEFLLRQDCDIAFFSAGKERHNACLVREYLSDDRMLGQARYQRLKNEGQFRVYSEQHLDCRERLPLQQILRSNQTLDNILLVDDYKYYACGTEQLVEVPRVSEHLNTMYYLLGLFMEYFETVPVLRAPLRTWFSGLHKVHGTWIVSNFAQLIAKGLAEVKKCEATAVYYPEQHPTDFKYFGHLNSVMSSLRLAHI